MREPKASETFTCVINTSASFGNVHAFGTGVHSVTANISNAHILTSNTNHLEIVSGEIKGKETPRNWNESKPRA